MTRRLGLGLSVAIAASLSLAACSRNQPEPAAPASDGKVDPRAPAPRDSSGRPDFSGIWQAESLPRDVAIKLLPDGIDGAQTIGESVPSGYFMNVLSDFKPGEITLVPAAQALFEQRASSFSRDLPSSYCLPLGLPMMDTGVFPHKFVHARDMLLILYEDLTNFRQIYMDGRPLPDDPEPAFAGHSIGRWDGDTLVVEVAGFKDNGWLDAFGHPHSDALRVTERFHRRDFGTMEVEVTVNDPKIYNRPFTFKFNQRLLPGDDLIESFCENEKNRDRLDRLRDAAQAKN